MINLKIRLAVVVVILIIIQACGYRMTEEDKYPDMEIYPQTSNANYEIDSFMHIKYDIRYTKEYMYVVTIKKIVNNQDQAYLSILDKDLNKVKEITDFVLAANSFKYNIDSNNTIYIVGNDNKLYKYDYPWKKAIEMPKILDVTQTDELKHQYAEIIELKLKTDSLFFVEGFIDSILNVKIKKLYDINRCVLTINSNETNRFVVLNDSNNTQSYAIVRDYSELWQNSYQNRKENCDSLLQNLSSQYNTESSNLELEQAALGNSSYGNHFAFSFSPYGYDYYKITINSDTIRFKIKNKNLNIPLIKQIGSGFTNQVLLYNQNKTTLYKVRKTHD